MSYPEPRYLAETGQASATYRPVSSPADLLLGSTRIDHLATGGSTDGAYGLFRYAMAGEPSGPGPHFHRTISESFFVLSGTVRLYDGRGWVDATAGDFLHVPPGGIHAFRNDSGAPAEMLLLFTPGAPREAYFAALEDLRAEGRTLHGDERRAFLRAHDQYDA